MTARLRLQIFWGFRFIGAKGMFCQLIYHLYLMTILGKLGEAKNFRNSHFTKEKDDGFEGYISGFMFLNCPFSQLSVKTIKVEPFKQK
ncbi:hypothetical protein [Bartonella apis]|uniref:hypothetical protein n=1 Tax=Bartonella apis TaxID=1686310 RepID=UPI002431C677|nr:hypothetical protein [Bartonella apis]MCT6886182.1 hypothetical protein [Bartonella apis]